MPITEPPITLCRIFTLGFLISALIQFTGDDVRAQSFVTGKVIDERSFPVPYAKVILNGKEVTADVTGRFLVSNTGIPYNVIVAERNTSAAVFYKDLTVTNPDLVLFGDPDPRHVRDSIGLRPACGAEPAGERHGGQRRRPRGCR